MRHLRLLHRKGKLPANQVKRLNDLGVPWNGSVWGMPYRPQGSQSADGDGTNGNGNGKNEVPALNAQVIRHLKCWNMMYPKVVVYLKKHKVWPFRSNPEGKAMYTWLTSMRSSYRSNKLTDDEIKQLDDLGFPWTGPLGETPFRPRRKVSIKAGNDDESSDDDSEDYTRPSVAVQSSKRRRFRCSTQFLLAACHR